MTPTDKQKCIAEQAVYGDLKAMLTEECLNRINRPYKDGRQSDPLIVHNKQDYYELWNPVRDFTEECDLDDFKLVLRPLSWLTREITHEGYNNGEPFIPQLEMMKLDCHNITYLGMNVVITEYSHLSKRMSDFLNMLHFDTRGLTAIGEAVSTEEVGDVYAVTTNK